MNIYKYAAQNGLVFPSIRGLLTIEQLFELPLEATSGFDLDSVAKSLNNSLKTLQEESFVKTAKSNPRKEILEIAFEIVKDVIKTKQDQNVAELNKLHKAEQKRKILDIMAKKRDGALENASNEELEKMLAEVSE